MRRSTFVLLALTLILSTAVAAHATTGSDIATDDPAAAICPAEGTLSITTPAPEAKTEEDPLCDELNLWCRCYEESTQQGCVNCCNNSYTSCANNCTWPIAQCIYQCEQNTAECVNQCYILF